MIRPLITDRDVRIACLELAVRAGRDCDAQLVAKAYYDFVTGADQLTPRERILQALVDANVT